MHVARNLGSVKFVLVALNYFFKKQIYFLRVQGKKQILNKLLKVIPYNNPKAFNTVLDYLVLPKFQIIEWFQLQLGGELNEISSTF